MKKELVLGAFGILVSALALGWAGRAIEWERLGRILSGIPVWIPFLAVAIYLTSFLPRAIRTRIMLEGTSPESVSWTHAGHAQIMGYAANNVLPLRLGEFVRVFALRKLAGVHGLTGFASLLTERIMDGVVVVMTLVITLSIYASRGRQIEGTQMAPLMMTAVGVFSIAIAGLVAMALMSNQIMRISRRFLPPTLQSATERVLGALQFLRSFQRATGVIGLTAAVWLIEGAVFAVVTASMGVDTPWMSGYLMLAVVNLGILIPSAPGYVGVFQACGVLAFQFLGIPQETGLAASLVVHACQFIPITLFGLLLASHHGWSLKAMARSKQQPSE